MRVRVRYSGQVQGVGFRATARSIAAGFAVSGWVKNEPDGSVLLEAQGAPADVEAFLTDLRAEMGANIRGEDRIGLADVGAEAGESGFVVRR